jgi:hypothetical protein
LRLSLCFSESTETGFLSAFFAPIDLIQSIA